MSSVPPLMRKACIPRAEPSRRTFSEPQSPGPIQGVKKMSILAQEEQTWPQQLPHHSGNLYMQRMWPLETISSSICSMLLVKVLLPKPRGVDRVFVFLTHGKCGLQGLSWRGPVYLQTLLAAGSSFHHQAGLAQLAGRPPHGYLCPDTGACMTGWKFLSREQGTRLPADLFPRY